MGVRQVELYFPVWIPARAATPLNWDANGDLLFFSRWFCWPQWDILFWRTVKLHQYVLYVRRYFSTVLNSLRLWYWMLNILLASMKLLTGTYSKNHSSRGSEARFWTWKTLFEPAYGPEYHTGSPLGQVHLPIFLCIQWGGDTWQNPPITEREEREAGSEIVMRLPKQSLHRKILWKTLKRD